jgi:hypothetical protein
VLYSWEINKKKNMNTTHKPGTLISYRNRDWIVMPSDDDEVVNIKPLGGSDDEITGVFVPLQLPGEELISTTIEYPTEENIGDFESAMTLFNASRLSFRNAAGPFRCMGKLSFRPRSYQVVPLVMSLKQDVTRLLIADDVGVGKTVEALMVLKEAMERGEVTIESESLRIFNDLKSNTVNPIWEMVVPEVLVIDVYIHHKNTKYYFV